VLRNPAYAGAYVFGRRRSRRRVEPDGTIRARTTMLPREQWGVVIHDHHPGYITWEQFLRIEQRLAANCTSRRRAPGSRGQRAAAGDRSLRLLWALDGDLLRQRRQARL
jgi:Recombinase